MQILSEGDSTTQAKILSGILQKYPPLSDQEGLRTEDKCRKIAGWISELNGTNPGSTTASAKVTPPEPATRTRPRLFIGSSSESLYLAYDLQALLERDAEVTIWDQGIFQISQNTLHSLESALNKFDFAVFLFSPDDALKLRDKTYNVVRDNVVFETGLFIGKLGSRKCFIIKPRHSGDLHLPSDLIGINLGDYDEGREDRNMKAALGPVAHEIRKQMSSLCTADG